MASRSGKGSARRPVRPSTQGGPRRLGQPSGRPTSADRRYVRSHRNRPTWLGWSSVGIVLVAVVVIVAVHFSGAGGGDSASGSSAGRHPPLAEASVVETLASVPAKTFNEIGTGGVQTTFAETKEQPALSLHGLPRFVYVGAEYCPYCAVMRWAIITALSRFGTFTGLKAITSSTDYKPIPTFSFLGSTYTSKYLVFTPYEIADRTGEALQTEPKQVAKLYATYDGSGTHAAKPFNTSPLGSGFPFLDIANLSVSSGTSWQNDPIPAIEGGGPGYLGIAQAISDPTSPVGKAIAAAAWVAQANYISAAICAADGNKPGSVCHSSGVEAAAKSMAKKTKVS